MNDKTARGRPEPGDALVEQLNGDVQALAAAVEQLTQRLRIRSGTPSRIIALEQQVRQLAGDGSRLPETGPGGWFS
jgi:uncharacterized protein involved in exopolysaccharide biosynthesis